MKHCLVVDDSAVIRKVARRILDELNFTTSEAENGFDALDQCRTSMPDAVLLDWNMPEMDGIAFLVALRKESGGQVSNPRSFSARRKTTWSTLPARSPPALTNTS